jgi:hypothetical protein
VQVAMLMIIGAEPGVAILILFICMFYIQYIFTGVIDDVIFTAR